MQRYQNKGLADRATWDWLKIDELWMHKNAGATRKLLKPKVCHKD